MGRKPKYATPEEMQERIDAYFEECKGHLLVNRNGDPVMDKFGHPIIMDAKPLTVTGLALALGFTNRLALLTYQAKPAFQETVERAKLRIENYAEMRLYDKDGSNGARFNLQNNFRGWNVDKESQENKAPSVTIICDIPRVQDPPQVSEDSSDKQQDAGDGAADG